MNTNNMQTIIIIIMATVCCSPILGQTQSLFQDVKARQVGDVITIILDENITGSSKAGNDARKSNASSASGSIDNDFISVDEFGAATSRDDQIINNATSNQEQLLLGTMSVHIVEVTDNGSLVVEGDRMIEINGEMQKITLKGSVRPIDVDTKNRVPSYRVADASIVFEQEGGIEGEKDRKGFLKIAMGVASVVSGLSSLIILGL